MDEDQISWLQGVLQTATMKFWSFPSRCIRTSSSRSIHVGKGTNRKGTYLQISEQAGNGKVYKIVIPQANMTIGWARLTNLIRDVYSAEHQSRVTHVPVHTQPQLVSPEISYADAVIYGGFYGRGKCSIKSHAGERFINVEDDGVKERH
ncbi:unnamed protein product [Linum trigynum]|uniref:Uncharacterized protein n=1 Tax=Linum trigynum TaxID=586398 RepID=A0AAV2FCE4_9ROSI